MARNSDLKALTYTVRVYKTEVQVTTIHTAQTVFQADGEYNGKPITATAGSRPAALRRWRELAEKTED